MPAAASHEDAQNYALEIGNIGNLLVQSGKKDEAVAWMHEFRGMGVSSWY